MNFEVEMIRQYVVDECLCKGRGFSRRDDDKWRRYYLFYVLRYSHNLTLFKIGKIFNLDHSTIVHGLKMWDLISHYPEVRKATKEVEEEFPLKVSQRNMRVTNNVVKSLLILENYASRENNNAIR